MIILGIAIFSFFIDLVMLKLAYIVNLIICFFCKVNLKLEACQDYIFQPLLFMKYFKTSVWTKPEYLVVI